MRKKEEVCGKWLQIRSRFLIGFFLLIFMLFTIDIMVFRKEIYSKAGISSSYLQKKDIAEGNIQRTDYVDRTGKIIYATDKHYATVIKTYQNQTLLEEYFDAEGEPARQANGYYSILREFNELGQNNRITYLDKKGKPTRTEYGYVYIERTFLKDGQIEYEWYYDFNAKPVKNGSFGYGKLLSYDKIGRNSQIVYLDADGKPMNTVAGYAILRRTFYEAGPASGKIENEYYFDTENRPIALAQGQYGLHRDYDEQGRDNTLTYLDAEGKPLMRPYECTVVKRTYYADNSVKTEMYYDIYGHQVSLPKGQYGTLRENGQIFYIDQNGNKLFNLNIYLQTHEHSVIAFAFFLILFSLFARKKANIILLALYLIFIIYMTLLQRSSIYSEARMELFWSYKQFFSSKQIRLDIMKNIWFFVPLGIIMYRLWNNPKAILLAVFFSVLVELIQYITGFGLADFDDIISNGLGAAIGFGFGSVLMPIKEKFKLRMAGVRGILKSFKT